MIVLKQEYSCFYTHVSFEWSLNSISINTVAIKVEIILINRSRCIQKLCIYEIIKWNRI